MQIKWVVARLEALELSRAQPIGSLLLSESR